MTNFSHAIRLSVILTGENLDPAELTSILAINPDRTKHRGQKIVREGRNTITHKNGLWSIRSNLVEVCGDVSYSKLLDRAFLELLPRLDILKSRLLIIGTNLSKLPNVEYAYSDFFIHKVTDSYFEPCEFVYSITQAKCFAELGLPTHFSVALGDD